jgi:hypothetical protein
MTEQGFTGPNYSQYGITPIGGLRNFQSLTTSPFMTFFIVAAALPNVSSSSFSCAMIKRAAVSPKESASRAFLVSSICKHQRLTMTRRAILEYFETLHNFELREIEDRNGRGLRNLESCHLERWYFRGVKPGLLNDCKTSAHLYTDRRPIVNFEFEKR